MKLTATIGGETKEIQPGDVDFVEVEPGVYTVIHKGIAHELAVDEAIDGSFVVSHKAGEIEITIDDPRRLAQAASGQGSGGSATLKAPMPGKVVEALVAKGDKVSEGQGILVIEAMKMEHAITAPASGNVEAVHFAEGDQVDEGLELLVLSAD